MPSLASLHFNFRSLLFVIFSLQWVIPAKHRAKIAVLVDPNMYSSRLRGNIIVQTKHQVCREVEGEDWSRRERERGGGESNREGERERERERGGGERGRERERERALLRERERERGRERGREREGGGGLRERGERERKRNRERERERERNERECMKRLIWHSPKSGSLLSLTNLISFSYSVLLSFLVQVMNIPLPFKGQSSGHLEVPYGIITMNSTFPVNSLRDFRVPIVLAGFPALFFFQG